MTVIIDFKRLCIYLLFFLHINNLNLELLKNLITIFSVSDKLKSMVKTIDFWRLCIENDQPEMFGTF